MNIVSLRYLLPELDHVTLDFIFDHVYDIAGIQGKLQAEVGSRLADLLEILKGWQQFGFHHRPDELSDLHEQAVIPAGLTLQSNSDGSIYGWRCCWQ